MLTSFTCKIHLKIRKNNLKKKKKVKLIYIIADVSFPKIFNLHKMLEKQ